MKLPVVKVRSFQGQAGSCQDSICNVNFVRKRQQAFSSFLSGLDLLGNRTAEICLIPHWICCLGELEKSDCNWANWMSRRMGVDRACKVGRNKRYPGPASSWRRMSPFCPVVACGGASKLDCRAALGLTAEQLVSSSMSLQPVGVSAPSAGGS